MAVIRRSGMPSLWEVEHEPVIAPVGPVCINCNKPIYLTAADGHWTHKMTEDRNCRSRYAEGRVAEPEVYHEQRKKR